MDVEQLRRDAQHVDYEVWMLMETARLLSAEAPHREDILQRALIESCLLHWRVLLEFFRTSKSAKDDLRAVDYFEDSPKRSEIENLAPAGGSYEDGRAKEIHKALAHLVTDRGKLNTDWSRWDLQVVIDRLRVFFRTLPSDRRSWFPRSGRWFAEDTRDE